MGDIDVSSANLTVPRVTIRPQVWSGGFTAMAMERTSGGGGGVISAIDVLDRVLDKGIVVDAWVRISVVGIDLVTVDARVVVASIDTYLRYAEAIGITGPAAH